jgi:hypothetical protein
MQPRRGRMTASAFGASTTRANSFSNASVLGTCRDHPERIDSAMSCIASSPIDGRAKGRNPFSRAVASLGLFCYDESPLRGSEQDRLRMSGGKSRSL